MSQLASKYDCESIEQLVAALVVQWNLPRVTNELFERIQEVEKANISLDEQVSQLSAIRKQFQIQNGMFFPKLKRLPRELFSCFFFLILYPEDMFQRIFTSLVLSLFGSLLIGPVFGVEHLEGSSLTILSHVPEFCSTNIECKKTQNGYITCESRGETLSIPRGSIHGIESEKTFGCKEGKENIFVFHDKKDLPYTFSDTSVTSFVYPFVRIIKIQV